MAASIALAIITLCLSCLVSTDAASKRSQGFSVELISRDSPNSPFYNPEETPTQRLANALRRSISRVHHFNPESHVSRKTVQSEIFSIRGEYLMRISLGTPPFDILAIADTGSDLIWTQCEPCSETCYQQDAPLFNPNSSSTYRDFSCSSRQCKRVSGSEECDSDGICHYSYSYGDRSFTHGNIAADTITLGSTSGRPVSLPNSVFGCGQNNQGTFGPQGTGIVGLGGGSISLISQLGSTIGGKFSYCLVPFFSTTGNSSKLNFGSNGVVSGAGVQSTPLTRKSPDTFYFLTLEAISVGNKRIKFSGSTFGTTKGNIIIDSGTTLTLVPEDFFSDLASAVESVIRGQRVNDPTNTLSLCYRVQSNLNIPILTAHFKGANVKLRSINTFVQVSEDVTCFSFAPISDGAIFGNLAQMNFLVGYDLEGNTVSFKPSDCSKE
ncbi:hypothetical protein P3X46_005278 [Hevea brasiliensis]|uniref:Peptidase A1 domain-containing protein n=1 Tax=Hevea brasiliensis TaxID=3981 RepID=A0ABQ9N2Y2_HEVBR|nr:aspartic proteinase CDR1-like [Hevea brasiliensis]KAJ9185678.1 hypothetical protein P3X46_005278 [Hevea brasiliensis]